jgi:hypothetical protein
MHCQTYRKRIYTTIQEKILLEHRSSEACFPNYSLLTIKENVQLVHVELQRSTLYVWLVIAWLAGKLQMS